MAKQTDNVMFGSFVAIALEGFACLAGLLLIPADSTSQFLLGYSLPRLAMAGAILAGVIASSFAAWWVRKSKNATKLEKLLGHRSILYFLMALSFVGLAFCLNWRFARPELLASLERIFPIALFATLANVHLAILSLRQKANANARSIAIGGLLVLLAAFYLNGAFHYSDLNKKYWLSDQQSFMLFTRNAKNSNFTFTGVRNYMPGYPYLQGLFVDTSQTDPQLYIEGKSINIILSLVLLGASFLLAKRYLNNYLALLFTLILAFTLFIYKAGYMQPEILYYFFAFLAFVMMARLFTQPSWYLAIGTGFVLALAHYTKASVLPAVGIFVVCMLGKSIYTWIKERDLRLASKSAMTVVLVILAFLGTLYPYLKESKEIYGQYFYNVASTFYVWYDNWNQVAPGTKAYGDSVGWPDMPEDEIPSLRNYVRTHTIGDVINRLGRGYAQQAKNIVVTFAVVSFPLLFGVAGAVTASQQKKRTGQILGEHAFMIAFVVLYFVGYLTLFGWYGPLVDYSDQRFTYGLYAPFLFCALYVLQVFSTKPAGQRNFNPPKWLPNFYVAIIVLLAADIILRVPVQLSSFHWFGK